MKQMSKKNIKKSIKLQGSAGKGAVCDDQIIALATAILTLTIASRSRCSMVNNWLAEKKENQEFRSDLNRILCQTSQQHINKKRQVKNSHLSFNNSRLLQVLKLHLGKENIHIDKTFFMS